MTPIEEQIEKLAEKIHDEIVENGGWEVMETFRRFGRELTPLIREECAKKYALKLMKVRDALIANDCNEAYHHLYELADAGRNSLDPWKEWMEIAAAIREGK